MKKKLLILILAILGSFACVIGLSACETVNGSDSTHTHTLHHYTAVEATCTSGGRIEHWECLSCCKKYSDEAATTQITNVTIPALGHDYGEWTETTASTCTTAGAETRYCSRNNSHTETRDIAKLGHTPSDWIIDTEAACETVGNKHKECTVCYAEIETAEIAALGHGTLSDWIIDTEAACETVGNKHKECTVCHAVIETAEISALGHSKGETIEVVSPVCGEQGYTTYACSVCGENFNADYQTALEHDFDSEWVCTLCGYEYETEGLVYGLYTESYGSHYEVIGYNGNSSQVIIPAHHDGLLVKTIGESAFKNNTSITEVFLSKQVTTIYPDAFRGCTSLSKINLRNNIKAIGLAAFQRTAFTSLSIPFVGNGSSETFFGYIFGATEWQNNRYYVPASLKTVIITGNIKTIPAMSFHSCDEITSITIPDSVTSIGGYAFGSCYSLTSVTMGNSVKIIGDDAFISCIRLTNITIPDSVTSIGAAAFASCSRLTSITIPDSVTSIGNVAFEGCSKLTEINYGGTKEQWDSITKGSNWNNSTGNYTIYCTDGTITKEEINSKNSV